MSIVFQSNFSAAVRAVNNLSLTMFSGEIFVLLGHNGAGKSTTIGALAGITRPTSGDVEVFGVSALSDFAAVRKTMGVCPQHDVLWDDLTCREHVALVLALRGHSRRADFDASAAEMLAAVGLAQRMDHKVVEGGGGKEGGSG